MFLEFCSQMPRFTVTEQVPYRNAFQDITISLKSTPLLGIKRQEIQNGSKHHYFSTFWRTMIERDSGIELLRKTLRELEGAYVTKRYDANRTGLERVDGQLVVPSPECSVEAFLDKDAFSKGLQRKITRITIETPIARIGLDLRDAEKRFVRLYSRYNIAEVITNLAICSSPALGLSHYLGSNNLDLNPLELDKLDLASLGPDTFSPFLNGLERDALLKVYQQILAQYPLPRLR